jgi:hypothetical protein
MVRTHESSAVDASGKASSISGKATKTTDRSRAPANPAVQARSRTTHARRVTVGAGSLIGRG